VLTISRRLADRDAENVTWQRDITVTLNKIGDLEKARRDVAAATAAYDESIAIRRRLLGRNPENIEAARDLQIALDRLGDVKIDALDFPAARAAYEERLALARKAVAKDPANSQWQKDLVFALIKLSQVADAAAGRAVLEEARALLEDLEKAGRLDAVQARWLKLVRDLLKDAPKGDKG
jgi:tetratricopeptide (TPR) repeat protein